MKFAIIGIALGFTLNSQAFLPDLIDLRLVCEANKSHFIDFTYLVRLGIGEYGTIINVPVESINIKPVPTAKSDETLVFHTIDSKIYPSQKVEITRTAKGQYHFKVSHQGALLDGFRRIVSSDCKKASLQKLSPLP